MTLWELLELCDSPGRGRTIAVGQMAHLLTDTQSRPTAARTVVTSGVSHSAPGVHMTLWELLELCDSPGRGRTIAVVQIAHLLTDTPLSLPS
jgi:hypothetical protein